MSVIEELPDEYCAICGEGPHWDVEKQSLYFVDIDAGMLMRYDYKENKVYRCKVEGEEFASFIIPIDGQADRFAVGCGRRVVILRWDGKSEECCIEYTLFDVQRNCAKFQDNRFNDAKCDPLGRLFAGTMRHGDNYEIRLGELYKYDRGNVESVKTDIGISNGLCWNQKTKKFYFIDTTDFEVKEYDYDIGRGIVCNPRVCFDLRNIEGANGVLFPDGMTIDCEGNIYVATFNGHTVYKVKPCNGEILKKFKMPCKQITSVAFGGPNLDILYVTTSSKFGEKPPAGKTFKLTGIGAKGCPMTKMRL